MSRRHIMISYMNLKSNDNTKRCAINILIIKNDKCMAPTVAP